jgi:hypothetical protein
LTATGDLLTRNVNNDLARLEVGTDDYVLTADSNEPTGLAWKPTAEAGTSVQEGRNIKMILIMEVNP